MNKGFTLIEVLLVIVLLTIVTALAIPRFNQSYAQLQLRDLTNDIAYLMRYAQSRAIHTARPLKLMFDEGNNSYWLTQAAPDDEEGPAAEEPPDVIYEKLPGRFGRVFKVPAEMTLAPTHSSVTFTPDGRIEKIQIDVCRQDQCMIVSTQNQSGYVAVIESPEEAQ